MSSFSERYQSEIEALRQKSRTRKLSLGEGADFTSNDYLALSESDSIRNALKNALDRGVPLGSGGSRLLRGNHAAHIELEEKAAHFFNCEKSLFFANGYSANFALLTSLPKRHDLIVFDALSHASIREGISASFAKSVKVPHNDVDAIERTLSKWHSTRSRNSLAWIAVESLYSMDGDFAPLAELIEIAERFDSMVLVDEAHATGVWGKRGRGLTEPYENHPNVIAVHTCGKALGAAGALVCTSAELINFLINKSRPFIYSTAPPPINAIAVSAALDLIDAEPERRVQLHELIALANHQMESKFELKGSGSQIIPFIVGADGHAIQVAEVMQNAGFDVRAIRPPTVPEGTARLRISITLNIEKSDILRFFDTLYEVKHSLNIN